MAITDFRFNGADCHVDLMSILRCGEIDLMWDARRIAQMVWDFTLLMSIFSFVVGISTPRQAASQSREFVQFYAEKRTERLAV